MTASALTWTQKQILLVMYDQDVLRRAHGHSSFKSYEVVWDMDHLFSYQMTRRANVGKLHTQLCVETKTRPRIASSDHFDDGQPWKLVHWSVNGHIWITKRGIAEAVKILNEGP